MTQGFTTVAKDRIGTKKLALFAVTNVLFKIYFKVNTLQLCGKLINVVEGPSSGSSGIMNDLHLYPVCDVVMYKYYLGRLKMFEDRYQEARYVTANFLVVMTLLMLMMIMMLMIVIITMIIIMMMIMVFIGIAYALLSVTVH